MAKGKELKGQRNSSGKTINEVPASTDASLIVWSFDEIDREGKFAFDTSRSDLDSKLIIDKMIDYSSMTWQEIKRQTHDGAKSKNHSIAVNELSKDAQARLRALKKEDVTDSLFFFALSNLIRLIGRRDGAVFHILWYDPNHEAYLTKNHR